MSNSNSSKQILLSVIGIAILVIAVVGVSFAFFNYTRTGTANTIRTGTITFNTENSSISITNVFPVDKDNIGSDTNNVGTGTVTITGSTNYNRGIDFTVTAEEVSSNIGTAAGKLPLSINVAATNLDNVTTFGSDEGAITINSYEDGTTITSGSVLATGRIPANTTVNGVLTIKAYIDADTVAISDTYYGNAPTPVPPTTPGPNDQYGTTDDWVRSRTVLTTSEWNALASTPASFKIKVVANQGS